jgi:hypothetical protein
MTAIVEPFLWNGFFVTISKLMLHILTQYLFKYTIRP